MGGTRANLRAEARLVVAEPAGLSCEGRMVDSAAVQAPDVAGRGGWCDGCWATGSRPANNNAPGAHEPTLCWCVEWPTMGGAKGVSGALLASEGARGDSAGRTPGGSEGGGGESRLHAGRLRRLRRRRTSERTGHA